MAQGLAYQTEMRALTAALIVAVVLSLTGSVAEAGQGNQSINVVSLDYCADQYVLALADRSQISGVSRGADEGYSFFRDRASGLRQIAGTVDEVLYLQPDIVVQTWGLSARMKEIANRSGIATVEAEYGSDPDTVLRNVTRIGASFGQAGRAADLVADYQERLEGLKALPVLPLRAAYITPSGYTSGKGTFVDEIIQLAGFSSWSTSRGLNGWQPLPLEDLILDPPDLFVTSFFDTSLSTQSHWSNARHGRLTKMLSEIPTVDLPGRYLACNGLFLVDAAERVRGGAEEMMQKRGRVVHVEGRADK